MLFSLQISNLSNLPVRCSNFNPVRSNNLVTCLVATVASSITSQWTFFTNIKVCDILVSSGICSGRRYVGVIIYNGSGILSEFIDDSCLSSFNDTFWSFFKLFSDSSRISLCKWFVNCCTNIEAMSGLSPFISWTLCTALLIYKRERERASVLKKGQSWTIMRSCSKIHHFFLEFRRSYIALYLFLG